MKKALLTLFTIVSMFGLQAQTCTPDTSYSMDGIWPVNGTSNGFDTVIMADAYVGMFYDEIVQIKVPTDTVIDTLGFQIPAQIDTLVLIDFDGRPGSISYQCNKMTCNYEGGENGCIRFVGTPTANEVGKYEIDIIVYGYINAGALGVLADTIEFEMELNVLPAQSIDEFISSRSIEISPNPFSNVANLSFEAKKNTAYTVRLVSLTGQEVGVIQGDAAVGKNQVEINRNNLPAGMYFYSLEIENQSHTGRFIINR